MGKRCNALWENRFRKEKKEIYLSFFTRLKEICPSSAWTYIYERENLISGPLYVYRSLDTLYETSIVAAIIYTNYTIPLEPQGLPARLLLLVFLVDFNIHVIQCLNHHFLTLSYNFPFFMIFILLSVNGQL